MTEAYEAPFPLLAIHVSADGVVQLLLQGRKDMQTVAPLLEHLNQSLRRHHTVDVRVDLSWVTFLDDYGALVLMELKAQVTAGSGHLQLTNASADVTHTLDQLFFYGPSVAQTVPCLPRARLLKKLGGATITDILRLKFMVAFVGSVVLALLYTIRHPKSLRWGDTVAVMEKPAFRRFAL